MKTEYKYKSFNIKIVTNHKLREPNVWDAFIFINGSPISSGLHQIEYPYKIHSSEEDAIVYARLAAEFVVDHPTGSSVDLDKLLR